MARLSKIEKFLSTLKSADPERDNWLIDREAELSMNGYGKIEAKEKALFDWSEFQEEQKLNQEKGRVE